MSYKGIAELPGGTVVWYEEDMQTDPINGDYPVVILKIGNADLRFSVFEKEGYLLTSDGQEHEI